MTDNKTIHPGKIGLGLFWEVMSLMKKAKNMAKQDKTSEPRALQDIPTQDPHLEYAKKDASFKQHRGAQR